MKKTGEVIFDVFVTIIITFFLNVFLSTLISPSGVIVINKQIESGDYRYANISLINYSNAIAENIIIEIPGDIQSVNVSGNIDYSITKTDIATYNNRITINKLFEKDNEELLIYYIPKSIDDIKIGNYKSNNFQVKSTKEFVNPLFELLKFAIISAVIYGIVVGVSNVLRIRAVNKVVLEAKQSTEKIKEELKNSIKNSEESIKLYKKNLKNLESDLGKIESENIKLTKQLIDVENRISKFHLLYSSKISEYRKELEFWRYTIRKLVSTKETEMFIKNVSKMLKTNGTQKEIDDFDVDYEDIVKSFSQEKK